MRGRTGQVGPWPDWPCRLLACGKAGKGTAKPPVRTCVIVFAQMYSIAEKGERSNPGAWPHGPIRATERRRNAALDRADASRPRRGFRWKGQVERRRMAVLRQQDGDSKNLQDILSVNSLGCLLLCGSTRCLTIPIVSSILEIEKESLPVRRLAQID